MVTRDWQLRLMKRLRFLRQLLPAWHGDEKDFRDWYLSLVERFDANEEKTYSLWVKILQVPEEVRGYREIRKPKMQEARRRAAELLNEMTQDPTQRNRLTSISIGSK